MREHPLDLIPFYIAGTLPDGSQVALESHLPECQSCRTELGDWQSISAGVVWLANEHKVPLPPLSPILRTGLRPPPTLPQALGSATNLIWAQRMLIFRSGILPAVALIIVLTSLSALLLPQDELLLPLLAVIPVLGVIITAMLSGPQGDPAYELVIAAPTRLGALIYARISLALGTLIFMASLSSLFLSALTGYPLPGTIVVWLAPLLLLTSLTTILSLLWSPLLTGAAALGSWLGALLLLARRQYLHVEAVSLGNQLAPLLDPAPWLVVGQLALALLFWALGWVLLTRGRYRSGFQENGR